MSYYTFEETHGRRPRFTLKLIADNGKTLATYRTRSQLIAWLIKQMLTPVRPEC